VYSSPALSVRFRIRLFTRTPLSDNPKPRITCHRARFTPHFWLFASLADFSRASRPDQGGTCVSQHSLLGTTRCGTPQSFRRIVGSATNLRHPSSKYRNVALGTSLGLYQVHVGQVEGETLYLFSMWHCETEYQRNEAREQQRALRVLPLFTSELHHSASTWRILAFAWTNSASGPVEET
jgi:hypothetical protein